MPKKACCCTVSPPITACPWCDYAWGGDQYNGEQAGPAPYSGLTGTLTTELPSIGHPYMRTLLGGNCACVDYRTLPLSPLPSFEYGDSSAYGDLCPAWYNGIDMNQSLETETSETNAYFKFLFYLEIQKRNDTGSYDEVIKIDWEGYGKNLRPHPDACKSYIVTNSTFINDICTEFSPDAGGEREVCALDFAKMPRGPWPYRLINKNLDYPEIECTDPDIGNLVSDCRFDCPINTDPYCQKCSECCAESNNGSSKGDNCFFLSKSGTPYGWEDCPKACSEFSNYASTEENLHFFSWLHPYSRYTTPEWDVKDTTTGGSRKLSIHSLVPNKANVDFCSPSLTQGLSFGEWCFGMDLEAPSEISTLESSGFTWSDGREKKGLWIHKTPTNALRVLFTLDHSDIKPGKVFRVFRDWDVENGNDSYLFWDNNEEGLFRIKFKQKVTEIAFSSLGCDCPQGNCDTYPICRENPPPPGCHDERVGAFKAQPCWTCNLSFTERGPIFVKMYAETENSGKIESETGNCKTTVGTEFCGDNNGLIMFAGPDGAVNGNKLTSVPYPHDTNDVDWIPYLDAIGDHPYGCGTGKGVDFYKYRSAYIPIESYAEGYCSLNRDCNNMPPFLYGSRACTYLAGDSYVQFVFNGWNECGPDHTPGCITYYNEPWPLPPINITPWPSTFPVNKCSIFTCGCPQFSDCDHRNFQFRRLNGDWPDAGVYNGEPYEEPPPEPQCGCNGVYCHESEECVPNLLKPNSILNLIRSNCTSSIESCYGHGNVEHFCNMDPAKKQIGMDGNQIVFNAKASFALYGGVGPPGCAQMCVGRRCHKINSLGNDTGICLFCEAGGSISGGYKEHTSVDWRKLLCYRKKSQPEALLSDIIPPNFMSNLEVNCNLGESCSENPLDPNSSPDSLCGGPARGNCDCYFMTHRNDNNGACDTSGAGTDEQPLRWYPCLYPNEIQNSSYHLRTEPWNDVEFQRKWLYAYPTKFESQAISQNRVPKYIKINAKGPYTE